MANLPSPNYTFALQPTPETPVATMQMQTIYETLYKDSNESMYDLVNLTKWFHTDFEMIPTAQRAGIALHRTYQALGDESMIRRLCMMLPFELTKSLVKHTLAYDFSRPRPPHPPMTYSPEHRGVYAVGIAIQGRGGKFLSGKEISEVSDLLADYVDGAEAFLRNNKKWDRSRGSHRSWSSNISKIDNYYYNRPQRARWEEPRWVQSVQGVQKTKALVRSLRVMAAAATATGTDTVPITQSPLMIGCTSKSFSIRCKAHFPASGLGSTTPTYALMLCAIASYNQLVPEPVAVPILATVQPEELSAAEIWITTIAQSLVFQTGFNIVEGGGTVDKSEQALITAATNNVYGGMPWIRQRIAEYKKRVKELTEPVQAWSDIKDLKLEIRRLKSEAGVFAIDLVKCRRQLDDWEEARKGQSGTLDEARELITKVRRELERVKDYIKMSQQVAEASRQVE